VSQYDYDLFVIGAGSGGVRASRMAASFGARVGICEDMRLGGTCVMRGCVPKKLLVYGAHFHEEIEDAQAYGWSVDSKSAKLDWGGLVAKKDLELNRLESVYRNILLSAEVALVEGRGTLIDEHTVKVNEQIITAERIIVATGGWPSMPDVPGIEHVITSNEALDLKTLPKSMVIVGGGYIAVEFAGIFNAVGVDVTEIIRAPNILRGFDEDVRDHLRQEMTKKGINILSGTVIESIEKTDAGYAVHLQGGRTLATNLVMYATGRKPKTSGLGLEKADIRLDEKGAIIVNEWFQTSCPSVYALGDVTDRVNLTPVALAEGMALAHTLFNNNPTIMNYENIPSAVFSHPPIGSVGLSEEDAAKRGDIDVYVSRFKPMKHTLSGRDEQSLMKLIVERSTDKVIGLHMVGPDSPEIAQGFAVAMKAGATKEHFDTTIGIHPTAAEELVTMREKRSDLKE
jgi:glutathione reductase (NADPH)